MIIILQPKKLIIFVLTTLTCLVLGTNYFSTICYKQCSFFYKIAELAIIKNSYQVCNTKILLKSVTFLKDFFFSSHIILSKKDIYIHFFLRSAEYIVWIFNYSVETFIYTTHFSLTFSQFPSCHLQSTYTGKWGFKKKM